ncbi:MAG: Ku protein [Variovorax sp.]|nr:MAG: Ku protein [Variovorax sp.]
MPRAPRSSRSSSSTASPTPSSAPAHAPRALWKGAISFGLVHIPIALYPATSEHAIDFDWLDKRTLDPVGYKRINKKTGREIPREQIVKGIAYESGRYVVLGDDEIAAAYPTTTQTIEIECFVPADGIPFIYLERPYYVAPVGKAAKVYALLREALRAAGRVGVARVVIQTKQHLAVLVPSGPGLVLNLLRWGADIRSWQDLPLPADGAEAAGLSERELKMAVQLVEDMSGDWDPHAWRDSFKDAIMKLVDHKVASGETSDTTALEDVPDPRRSEARIIDLTELLQRSLRKGHGDGGTTSKPSRAAKAAKVAKATGTGRAASATTKAKAAPAKAPRRRAA